MNLFLRGLKYLVKGGFEFVFGIIHYIFLLIDKTSIIFFFLACGVILLSSAYIFMVSIPVLISSSDLIDVQINAIDIAFTSVEDVIAFIVNAIKTISSGHASHLMKYADYHIYPASKIRNVLQNIQNDCVIGNPFTAISNIYRIYTQKSVCASVRITAAVLWLFNILEPIATGLNLYEGSAYPDVSATHSEFSNCRATPPTVQYIYTCTALNSGNFFIFLMFLMLLTALFYCLYKALGLLLLGILDITWFSLMKLNGLIKHAIAILEL